MAMVIKNFATPSPGLLQRLQEYRLPYIIKTTYVDGKPATVTPLPVTVSHAKGFYRVNGRVVSRNVAADVMRAG